MSFVDAWEKANPGAGRPTAPMLDQQLHAERIGPGKSKQVFSATIGDLPDGVFVSLTQEVERAYLLWNRKLHAWSAGGYTARVSISASSRVNVLTPRSTVNSIRCGYVPDVHASIDLGTCDEFERSV